MIEQLTHNWICWAILLLALTCYQQLCMDLLRNLYSYDDSNNGELGKHGNIIDKKI